MASGEAGTLADAVSPASNPNLIYAGGQNNGASSGVLKSVDGGRHWTVASNGMFGTRVEGLHIIDGVGLRLYVAVANGGACRGAQGLQCHADLATLHTCGCWYHRAVLGHNV